MTDTSTPTESKAAGALDALGNVTRLKLFRLLVQSGPAGLRVGEIQRQLGIPPSTAAHHIARLESAGLMIQRRRGREIICMPDFDAMSGLVAYITDNCCEGACPALEADVA